MQIIPIKATPNQTLSVLLGGQSCQIDIWTRLDGTYLDLTINNSVSIVNNVVCQDKNRLVRYPYLGFVGDLWFFDTQGSTNPVYTGFGSRYLLQYIELSDIAAAGLKA